MRGDVLGLERRRRWDDEEKRGIVLAVGVDGATVTQVAQRHDVTRQQIYAWRHELKKKGLLLASADTLFLPISVPEPAEAALPEAVRSSLPTPEPQIELVLANGRRLRFAPDVEPAVLVRLIRVVETALSHWNLLSSRYEKILLMQPPNHGEDYHPVPGADGSGGRLTSIRTPSPGTAEPWTRAPTETVTIADGLLLSSYVSLLPDQNIHRR